MRVRSEPAAALGRPKNVIEALLLDFDGLVTDTETTDYESWRSVYADYDVVLPRERWVASIGSDGSSFVPLEHLRELLAAREQRMDEEHVQTTRRARREALFESLEPLPGVVDWLTEAQSRGLPIGIVSSSPRWWVDGHLQRLDLRGHVDFLMTADEVSCVKPHPGLYLRALVEVGVPADRVIAVEDSPNGLHAAKAAALFCLAVPGPMTRGMDFSAADLLVESLAHHSLEDVASLLAEPSSNR